MRFLKRGYTKSEAFGALAMIFGMGMFFDLIWGRLRVFAYLFPLILVAIGIQLLKNKKKISGLVFLVIGGLNILGTMLSTFAFMLVFIAVIIYYGYQTFIAKDEKMVVKVGSEPASDQKSFVKKQTQFNNLLVGKMRQLEGSFALEDINVLYGFGDISLDLTQALIPKGETVILIRGVVGDVQILVPYDLELSIHASVIIGQVRLPGSYKDALHRTEKYLSPDYETSSRRVRIISSQLIGDVEVRQR